MIAFTISIVSFVTLLSIALYHIRVDKPEDFFDE